jgi:uncharacterized protein (TIGR02145 family)
VKKIKLKTILVALLILCNNSCSKDNNDSDNNNNGNNSNSGCSGGPTSVTDIDGNVYQVVSIGNQCWMKENLRVTKFKNGDPISLVTGNSNWANTQQPAYCYYNNDLQNEAKYGKLYNGIAVNDPRGLAPDGWRVPNENDWNELFNYLGGYQIAGKAMKVTGNGNFGLVNTGTNSSGFSALPGGRRVGNTGAGNSGLFTVMGTSAFFWGTNTYSFYITDAQDFTYGGSGSFLSNGASVRLIRE